MEEEAATGSEAHCPAPAKWQHWGISAVLGCLTLGLFAHHVDRFLFLSDDAFISFRYARHLVDGLGLVWNPGERVEGYTNFSWVIAMAAGLRLGVGPERLSIVLGIASGIAILTSLVRFDAARLGFGDVRIWAVPLLLSASRSFTGWCSGGLETQFFSLWILLAALTLIRERERDEAFPWRSSLLFACATLTRPDGAVFMAAAGACLLTDTLRRGDSLRRIVVWALPFIAIVGSHALWRYSYYGYWFPNTFYAKVTFFSLERSLHYFSLFWGDYKILWWLPLMGIAIYHRRDFTVALFSALIAVFWSYLFYVGGDFLEFRFLVPTLPFLYWLIAQGIMRIGELVESRKPIGWQGVAVAAVCFAGVWGTTFYGSTRLKSRMSRGGVEGIELTRDFTVMRSVQGRKLRALTDAGVLPADLRVETGPTGALPYYTDWYVLDKYGLSDVAIAHRRLEKHRKKVGHDRTFRWQDLRDRRIAVVLIGWHLLIEGSEKGLDKARNKKRKTVEHLAGLADDPELALRFKCLRVAPAQELMFGTSLPEAEFQQLLGHIPPCRDREASS